MDHYKNSLYDIKNLTMVRDISLKKIKQMTGVSIDSEESFYRVPFNEIINEVAEYYSEFKTITKANNVIITELVKFIVKKINMQHSTPLDDIEEYDNAPYEENNEMDDKKEHVLISKQEDVLYQNEKTSQFIEEVYCFEMNEMVRNDTDAYDYDLYIKNVKEVKVISCTIDNSDYIVNENNNIIEIDNQTIKLPIGNYNSQELTQKIQGEIDILVNSKTENFCKLELKVSRVDDCFSFEFQKLFTEKKSLTGSIKESQMERSTLIDLSCKNSMCCLIGFQPKTYKILIGDNIVGKKHKITFTSHVKMDFNIISEENIVKCINQRILMNVPYNSTKHHIPEVSNSFSANELFDFDRISISFLNNESKMFNTRDRIFSVDVIIKKLI